MPLIPGDKLGPYEIVVLLGAGGMGEVYRAHDTRLGRDVALKVSAERFNERFEREARAIAALNHSNVCTLHDVGPNYLVMELVEGHTLAERIKEGAIPLEETLDIARQIAAALEAAHEKGITHRDLKPGNIILKPGGAPGSTVKVLDFGLAKIGSTPTAQSENSPTITMSATQAGVILGTAAYMAPEQARGREVDKRADIWAFGVVLYEMLTGQRLFQGEDLTETLASVVKEKPDLSSVPAQVRRLLERCLEKDPRKRLRDIGDMELLLVAASPPVSIPVPTRFGKLPWIGVVVLALALIAAGAGWYNSATRPTPLRPLIRLNAEIAPDAPLARGIAISSFGGNMLALSPDGARLALTLRAKDGKVRLHTRLLNQSQVTPLTGTDGAQGPFFSPAGDWIGFFADGKLKKISVEGGAPVTLCDAPAGFGASWGDDGNIIVAPGSNVVLSRVASGGGTPVPLTKFNSGENTHRWPQVLPGSQAVLFTAAIQGAGIQPYDDANIEVLSLKTGERKTVARGGFSPRYLATATGAGTGHLVYVRESTLFATPFDPVRLVTTGSPAPILEDVSSTGPGGADIAFAGALSGPGTFVYLTGKGDRAWWSISWLDSSGKIQPLHTPSGRYVTPRFSPDGKRLAFSMASGKGEDIWLKDLDRDTPSRLSFLPDVNRYPVWTPDGKIIVFQSRNPAAPGLYWIRSDGSGEAKRLTEGNARQIPFSFSPDGKRLAFSQAGNGGAPDIFTVSVEVDPGQGAVGLRLGKPELFLGTPFNESDPVFSPDGRFLAYQSNESGTTEVYVRPFPRPGGRWQVSAGGGRSPRWSRDGHELLFVGSGEKVMAVSYTVTHAAEGDSFAVAKPRVWAEAHLRQTGNASYDLAPDGKRLAAFVEAEEAEGSEPTHLTFLVNFFDELQRRAPTGK